ncbi:MAG: TetR/AcrR family transcriptional regulator [Frankia sp.]
MPGVISPSAKEQIVRAAEQLFAERGIDGVSLRQIGVTAGNGNNSAVQYHFGSKEELIRAIFEYRLPHLHERRRMLIARGRPGDLRSWVECYVLPILEQGEQEGSHYLGFVAMLQQFGRHDVLDHLGEEFRRSTPAFADQLKNLLPHVPEPLRTHRVNQALAFSVHAAADRERAQSCGRNVLPFAVHVSDLLDGLLGFLEAPVSPDALAALESTDPNSLAQPLLP